MCYVQRIRSATTYCNLTSVNCCVATEHRCWISPPPPRSTFKTHRVRLQSTTAVMRTSQRCGWSTDLSRCPAANHPDRISFAVRRWQPFPIAGSRRAGKMQRSVRPSFAAFLSETPPPWSRNDKHLTDPSTIVSCLQPLAPSFKDVPVY